MQTSKRPRTNCTPLNIALRNIKPNFSFKKLSSSSRLNYLNLFARIKNNDKLIDAYSHLINSCIVCIKKILINYPQIDLPIDQEICLQNDYKKKFISLKTINNEIYHYFNPKKDDQQEIDFALKTQRIENKDNLNLRLLKLVLDEFFEIFPSADEILVPNNFLKIKKIFFLSPEEKTTRLEKANLMLDLLELITSKKFSIFEINSEQNRSFKENLEIIAEALHGSKADHLPITQHHEITQLQVAEQQIPSDSEIFTQDKTTSPRPTLSLSAHLATDNRVTKLQPLSLREHKA